MRREVIEFNYLKIKLSLQVMPKVSKYKLASVVDRWMRWVVLVIPSTPLLSYLFATTRPLPSQPLPDCNGALKSFNIGCSTYPIYS